MFALPRCDNCHKRVPWTDLRYVRDWTDTVDMNCCPECAEKAWAAQDAIAEIDEREEEQGA